MQTKHVLAILVTLLCIWGCRTQTLKYEVLEEQKPGTFVADIANTSDPQTIKRVFSGPMRFTFQDSKQKAFHINETTGILRTNQVLDRESLALSDDTLLLRIVCSVGRISAVVPVNVKVLDINDNRPRFPQPVEDILISEAAALNVAEFGVEGGQDADIGNNSIQGYEIVKRNDDNTFGLRVKHPSPEITKIFLVVLKKLDREKNDSYSLTIQAKDGGNPAKTGEKELNITILDSNDNSPKFSQGLYTGQVKENEPKGSFIVNVTATDLDLGTNAEIRYSLAQRPEYKDLFTLDSITGELKTNAELDYENTPQYQLEVIAKDQGADAIQSSAIVKVQVLDENDNSPTITVRFLNQAVDSQNRLPEDVKVGSGVALVEAQDEDSGVNGKVSITVQGHHSDFALREFLAGQYILEVKQPLNLDKFSQYDILFKAEDHGTPPRQVNQSFVLRLADSNRNAPKFKSSLYRVEVADDASPGSFVSTPTATDADYGRNARLTYSLESVQMIGRNTAGLGNTGNWFSFETQTGKVRLMKTLWCTFTPGFVLRINVRDGGRVPRTASTTVNVTVTCKKNVQHFSVPENQPIGAHVGTVMLTPIVPNQKLLIRLLPQEQENFKIDNETGVITTTRTLNREDVSFYELKGVISDGQLQMAVTLNIRVLDENDNTPMFVDISSNQLVSISGDARVGERVFKVRAIDADSGKNGEIVYSIEEGNDDGAFAMDEGTGELVVMDAFSRKSYELLLRAADQGDITKETFIRIQLEIKASVITPSVAAPGPFTTWSSKTASRGFFSNTKVMIVVGVCGFLVLLAVVVVVVILAIRRKKRKSERGVAELALSPEEKRYSGHEISREEAIKVTKKMYSNATENYYKHPSALQKAKKLSTDNTEPLLHGRSATYNPRMPGTSSQNGFYAAAPKNSPHEDDLDSGRGGSTSESTPPSARSQAPRRSIPQERDPPSGYSSDPVRTHVRTHIPNGQDRRRDQRPRGPVVNMPFRDGQRGLRTVATLPGITHSTTDL